jgi:formate dehydrogenase subunit gamma
LQYATSNQADQDHQHQSWYSDPVVAAMGAKDSTNGDAGFEARVIDEIIAGLADKPGALMPVLHAVNERVGYIPSTAVPAIARGLNLSRAEVHGVISFYHDFRT